MAELSYTTIGAIMTLVIVTAAGLTYYIAEDEGYRNCMGGSWILNETSGMYDCASRGISEWCFKVSENGAYRCYLGDPIEIPSEVENSTMIYANGCLWQCPDKICSDFDLCTCQGRQTYRGELVSCK